MMKSRVLPVFFLVLAVGCAGSLGELFRRHTYPPSFHYQSTKEVRSTMWQLGAETWKLDRALHREETSSTEVLAILEQMEQLSRELGPGSVPSNHPMLTHNVDRLRDDIALAKRGAERTPPSYALAGMLPGACLYCHGERR
jgi:hypothetical protein